MSACDSVLRKDVSSTFLPSMEEPSCIFQDRTFSGFGPLARSFGEPDRRLSIMAPGLDVVLPGLTWLSTATPCSAKLPSWKSKCFVKSVT